MFLYIFLVFGFSSLFYFVGAMCFLRWALNTVKFLVVCMSLTILLYASCIVYTLTTSPPCSDEKALQAIDKLVSRSDQIFFPSDLIHVKKKLGMLNRFRACASVCARTCVCVGMGGGCQFNTKDPDMQKKPSNLIFQMDKRVCVGMFLNALTVLSIICRCRLI